MLALIGLFDVAGAATPVLADGIPLDDAVRRAAWATGHAPDTLQPLAAGDLFAPGLRAEGAARLDGCGGDPTDPAQLDYLLDRVDGALGWADYPAAQASLGEATAVVRCLSSPPAPPDVARWQAMSGVVASRDASRDAAGWFALARATDEDFAFDPSWPVEPPPDDGPDRRTRLWIVAPAAGVHVDGRLVDSVGAQLLAPGAHPITLGGRGHLLTLEGGSDGWIVDVDLPSDTVDAPGTRPAAAALLAARFGEGAPALVVTKRAVWAAPAGQTDWVQLERSRISPWIPAGSAVTAIGGAAAAVGTALALGHVGEAGQAGRDQSAAASTDAFEKASARYEEEAAAIRRWRGVAIGGAILVGAGGTGLTIGLAGGRVSVRPKEGTP